MASLPAKCPHCSKPIDRVPSPRGRKALLDKAIRDRICDQIRQVMPTVTAAVRGGIPRSTFYLWLEKGRLQKRGRYRDFLDAIEGAEADRQAINSARLSAAAAGDVKKKQPPDWRAGFELAKVTDRHIFGVQVTVKVDEELNSAVEKLWHEFRDEPETLRRALGALVGERGFTLPGAPRGDDESEGGRAAPPPEPPPATPDPV